MKSVSSGKHGIATLFSGASSRFVRKNEINRMMSPFHLKRKQQQRQQQQQQPNQHYHKEAMIVTPSSKSKATTIQQQYFTKLTPNRIMSPFHLKRERKQQQQQQSNQHYHKEAMMVTPTSKSKATAIQPQHLTKLTPNSIVSGSMPLLIQKPLSEEQYVNALTAVTMSQTELSHNMIEENIKNFYEEGNNLSLNDLSEIKSVSTVKSRVELSSKKFKTTSGSKRQRKSSRSLVSGKVFFYLEQEAKTTNGMGLSEGNKPSFDGIALTPGEGNNENSQLLDSPKSEIPIVIKNEKESTIPQEFIICHDQATPQGSEEYEVPSMQKVEVYDFLNENSFEGEIRAFIAEKVKCEMDNNDFSAVGKAMYEQGEELLALGQIEQAKVVFERAQELQKESITRLSTKLAKMLHTQGLNHCDNGDKRLAIVLLGVAEVLKHNPINVEHIQMATQLQLRYRKICPRDNPEFRLPRKAMEKTVRELGLQAKPLAETMKAYAKTGRLLAAVNN